MANRPRLIIKPAMSTSLSPLPNPFLQEATLSNSLPQAGERASVKNNLQFRGEGANESLREFNVMPQRDVLALPKVSFRQPSEPQAAFSVLDFLWLIVPGTAIRG